MQGNIPDLYIKFNFNNSNYDVLGDSFQECLGEIVSVINDIINEIPNDRIKKKNLINNVNKSLKNLKRSLAI